MPDPKTEEQQLEEMRVEQKEAQETLETNAEATLAKLRGEFTPDESESESTSEQSDEEQTDESQETDESTSEQSEKTEQTDESESEEESTSEETSKETEQTDDASDSKADDKPELTQAEIRAAKHLGWSEDEINELAQANPDLAKKTCAKALESTNNLSKKFSELGKAQVVKKEEPDPKPESKPEPKPIDFTVLEKEYENDPIVGILKQFETRDRVWETELAALRASNTQDAAKVDGAKAQEDAAISQQIDTFFESPDVTAYKKVYGEIEKGSRDWDNLTQGQIKKRYEVVEEANMIREGHKVAFPNAEEMPVSEAFERAHDYLTIDEREQTIRKSIKAKAVKRSKSLTLEPATAKKIPDTGKKTMTKVYANAERLLAKLRRR